MSEIEAIGTEAPLWRRIVDFPLVAMVIAILLYAFASIVAIISFRTFPAMPANDSAALHAAVYVLVGLAAYKLAIRHLGDPQRDDLPRRGAFRLLGLGLLLGVVLFSVVVGIAALIGVYQITGSGSTGELVSDLAGAGVTAAFMEELLFRGILFRWIEEFGGSWGALVVTSALFGIAHIQNPHATWFSSFAVAMEAGVLLGGAYMLTRSLWTPMGLHAGWNFTQGFIFGVPVSGTEEHGLVQAKLSGPVLLSGGSFGLEASVIALVLATAAGVWLVVLAVRRGETIRPWWVRRRQINSV